MRGVARAAHTRSVVLILTGKLLLSMSSTSASTAYIAMATPAQSRPKPRKNRRIAVHSRRSAGRDCMARKPRNQSVGTSAPASAKVNTAPTVSIGLGLCFRSALALLSKANPVPRTTTVMHTMRMAVASVGKRARRSRQMPSGNSEKNDPGWTSIGWPVCNIKEGVTAITKRAHPVWTIAKLTRSLRPAADLRAALSLFLTPAALVALGRLSRASPVVDCEGSACGAGRPPARVQPLGPLRWAPRNAARASPLGRGAVQGGQDGDGDGDDGRPRRPRAE